MSVGSEGINAQHTVDVHPSVPELKGAVNLNVVYFFPKAILNGLV
jgi:hypothetical protein